MHVGTEMDLLMLVALKKMAVAKLLNGMLDNQPL